MSMFVHSSSSSSVLFRILLVQNAAISAESVLTRYGGQRPQLQCHVCYRHKVQSDDCLAVDLILGNSSIVVNNRFSFSVAPGFSV
uniref:Secreted protein n=1 Tax=Pararge aegeria TaxID=116150 RepID=S4P695_9NEOP